MVDGVSPNSYRLLRSRTYVALFDLECYDIIIKPSQWIRNGQISYRARTLKNWLRTEKYHDPRTDSKKTINELFKKIESYVVFKWSISLIVALV